MRNNLTLGRILGRFNFINWSPLYAQKGCATTVFSPNEDKGDSVSEGETKYLGDLK